MTTTHLRTLSCFFVLVAIASLSTQALAVDTTASTGTSKNQTSSTKTRYSVVVAPETLVYEKPDLDSKPFAILPQGTRIPVSKGTRGEYQKFYRTKFQGKPGWVLTIDVRPEAQVRKAIAKAKAAAKGKKSQKGPFAAMNEAEENQEGSGKNPYVFSQSASLVFGVVDFREDVAGQSFGESVTVYGFKITGPDVVIQGPVVDINFLLHYGAPAYYDNLSSTKPSGFLVWLDAQLVMPLRMREDSLIAAMAGPTLTLSSIQSSVGAQSESSFDARIGAVLSVAGGMRFDGLSTRLEARYVIEGKSYPQFLFSLGTMF